MGATGIDRVGKMNSAGRANWNYHVNLFLEHLTANDADYGLALAAWSLVALRQVFKKSITKERAFVKLSGINQIEYFVGFENPTKPVNDLK